MARGIAGPPGPAIPRAVDQGRYGDDSLPVPGMPTQPDVLPGVEGLGLGPTQPALPPRQGQHPDDRLHDFNLYETASYTRGRKVNFLRKGEGGLAPANLPPPIRASRSAME